MPHYSPGEDHDRLRDFQADVCIHRPVVDHISDNMVLVLHQWTPTYTIWVVQKTVNNSKKPNIKKYWNY